MTRQIEIHPGQMFAASDKMILVRKYESFIGMSGILGAELDQACVMRTYQGKLNKKNRSGDVTLLMSVEDAFREACEVIEMVEKILARNGDGSEENEEKVPPREDWNDQSEDIEAWASEKDAEKAERDAAEKEESDG